MKIAVLGCGNMATPIVEKMYESNIDLQFFTYTPSETRAIILANKVKGEAICELSNFPKVDYCFIACKPQQFEALVRQMPESLKSVDTISIMAGIPVSRLTKELGHDRVIRVMPNTPIMLGAGISLIYGQVPNSDKFRIQIKNWFDLCGLTVDVKTEKEFDELTTISGSGPAYIFNFARGYFSKLQSLGIENDTARKIVNSMFSGASLLMENDTSSLINLMNNVTSKGGVTESALAVLNQDEALLKLISTSIDAAIKRSDELSLL